MGLLCFPAQLHGMCQRVLYDVLQFCTVLCLTMAAVDHGCQPQGQGAVFCCCLVHAVHCAVQVGCVPCAYALGLAWRLRMTSVYPSCVDMYIESVQVADANLWCLVTKVKDDS
jgi:hypothetical protein